MRGRINRAGYWLVLLVAVAMYVIISMFGSKPPAITELFLIFLCVPRFHDLGTSGWWVAIPLAIEVVGAIAAFTLFSMEQATVIAGGIAMAVAAFVVVLGLIPGQPHANRFGEPPKSLFPSRERRKVSETEETFK